MVPNVAADPNITAQWLRSLSNVAIPVYQREYRWTLSTCEQLLRDVRRVADAPVGTTHFIGTILVKASDDEAVTLVDGQQRITTLMLMIAAIQQLSADSPARPDVAGLLRGASGAAKLVPHERYSEVIERLMAGSTWPAGETSFEENYAALVDLIGDEWELVWRGLERLEHVTIRLGDRSNAQQIFESLNSTGARLSDDELIHNYIHMGRGLNEQRELELATWIPIEDATRGALREFWRDYLVWSAPETLDLSGEFGIYRAFRGRYPNPLDDLTPEISAEWRRFANWYAILRDPGLEEDADVAAQLRLVRWFEGTPRPLLLGMYDDYASKRIPKQTFIDALEQLQTMFIRRTLVNLDRDLRMIGTLCRELRESGYPVTGLVRRSPEDPQVRLALSHGTLPNPAYVLSRLQRPSPHLGELQVEHIYPQTPDVAWSGDGGATRWGMLTTEQQAEFRTVLNTIGNLTLLEAPLNQGAGNKPFREKAAKYYSRSQVQETVALGSREVWTFQSIKQRTDHLIERFLEEWPRPNDAPMDEPDDLVRVVDLERTPVRGYPDVFEYAVFKGEVWGEVRDVKGLLVNVVAALLKIDAERLMTHEYGWFVRKTREPGKSQERLPGGAWVYTGWSNRYLLAVVQELTTSFELDDEVKVKLVETTEPTT